MCKHTSVYLHFIYLCIYLIIIASLGGVKIVSLWLEGLVLLFLLLCLFRYSLSLNSLFSVLLL